MSRINSILAILAGAALVGPTVVQAEGFGHGRSCGGSSFGTCSAAEVRVEGITLYSSWKGSPGLGLLRFRTIAARSRWEHPDTPSGRPGAITVTPCPVPSANPLDCPASTVTPEPVTMTLLATGLASMTGMGFIRRKKRNGTT